MKFFLLIFSVFMLAGTSEWLTSFEQAKKTAIEKNELILLNFSGSDWCGPCMRMRKEIFESADFKNFAEGNLVLVNADFPRNKKNKLSKDQETQNDKLAEKYNPEGKFPFTILLNTKGETITSWEGLPQLSPAEYVQQIKLASGNKK